MTEEVIEQSPVEPAAAARRLMLVHAHPDDESIGNGATMARYVGEGAAVTLVTCTLGEEGEVLVGDLEGEAAGQMFRGELDEVVKALAQEFQAEQLAALSGETV